MNVRTSGSFVAQGLLLTVPFNVRVSTPTVGTVSAGQRHEAFAEFGTSMRRCNTRNLAGNPDSPQAVIFLTSITDVMMGLSKRIAYTITPYTTVIRLLGVVQNPANGFPARPLGRQPRATTRRRVMLAWRRSAVPAGRCKPTWSRRRAGTRPVRWNCQDWRCGFGFCGRVALDHIMADYEKIHLPANLPNLVVF